MTTLAPHVSALGSRCRWRRRTRSPHCISKTPDPLRPFSYKQKMPILAQRSEAPEGIEPLSRQLLAKPGASGPGCGGSRGEGSSAADFPGRRVPAPDSVSRGSFWARGERAGSLTTAPLRLTQWRADSPQGTMVGRSPQSGALFIAGQKPVSTDRRWAYRSGGTGVEGIGSRKEVTGCQAPSETRAGAKRPPD